MTPAIFGCSGLKLTADERAFFRDADPAGYILFERNCKTREQVRALTDELRDLHGRDRLLVSIDQEGGRVARMKPPEWSKYPPGEAFDRLYRLAPASAIEAARLNSQAMGHELAEAGVNVDFHAPFDVRRPETVDAIGDRALGSEPMQVAALGRAVLEGLALAGVAGCLKHMPGHGRATCDTHKEMPKVTASEGDLAVDIQPFRALASKASIGMSAHILFPAWDTESPATLSKTIVRDVIRGAIGFDGLLLTDDIDMEALDGTIADRAARAHAAGCEVILNCWAKMDDMKSICDVLPPMSQQAIARLDRALEDTRIDPTPFDKQAELLAKRDALLALMEKAA